VITCPTCSSPLPSGAMICGHCGRTITAADVAAARRAAHPHEASHGADGTHGAPHGAPPAPPSWQQRRDLRPDVEPWWVGDRGPLATAPADHPPAGDERQDDQRQGDERQGDEREGDEREGAERPGADGVDEAPRPSGPLDWPPPRLPGTTDEGDAPSPRSSVRPATPTRDASPLRPPLIHDDAPRPTSAPLWTASIAPLPVPDPPIGADSPSSPDVPVSADAPTSVDEPAGADAPAGVEGAAGDDAQSRADARTGADVRTAPVRGDGRDDDVADHAAPGDSAAAAESQHPAPVDSVTTDPSGRSEDVDPSSQPTTDGPAADGAASRAGTTARAHRDDVAGPGDTATVVPLPDLAVAPPLPGAGDGTSGPAPLVEPPADGTATVAERCGQCGALLDEDDIFCGECGAVVQSVARSFTGPVAPLPPTWVPPVATRAAASDGGPDEATTGGVAAGRDAAGTTGVSRDAGTTGASRDAGTTGTARDADGTTGVSRDASATHHDVPAPDDGHRDPSERGIDGPGRSSDVPPAPAPAPSAPQHPGAHRGEETTSTGAGPWRRRGRRARVDVGPPPPLVLPGSSTPSRDALAAAEAAERAAAALGPRGATSSDGGSRVGGSPVGDAPGTARPPLPPGSAPAAPSSWAAPATAPGAPPAPATGHRDQPPAEVPARAGGASPWAGAGRPDPSWQQARPDEDDDVDETRIVARRPWGVEYRLQFSTGETVTISGSGLLGRAPVVQPGETFDEVVRIVDPGKSVSKTHLEFGQDSGQLWVSDRWSGNGTAVRHGDEAPRRVQPGTRVRVHRGGRVDIGEQFFVVL